jgi:hypothetical protein
MGGQKFDIPQYVEMAYPEMKQKEPTAEEIKNHILERLKEG